MTDDDRTIDADDGMLDELRRLAADARAQPQPDPNPDETVDADESTMDLLRQFAAEARADPSASATGADSDETPPGGFEALPTGKLDPPAAAPLAAPTPDTSPLRDDPGPVSDPLPSLEVPAVPSARPTAEGRSALPPLDDLIEPRSDTSAAPTPSAAGSSWRPPPRMVMPAEPERLHRSDSHRWRVVSLALAAVLIVVLAFLGYTALTGDDSPADDVPEELPLDGNPDEPGAPDGSEDGSDGG